MNYLDAAMLSLYFDHHIDAAIAIGLRRRGVDVLTAFEDGTARYSDDVLLQRATELGRVLVTQDKGFHFLAQRRRSTRRDFAGILFAIQGRVTVGDAIEYLELFVHVMSADEMLNRLEYIPAS